MIIIGLCFVSSMIFTAGTKEEDKVAPPETGGAGLGYKFVMIGHWLSGDPFHSVVKQGMEDAALVRQRVYLSKYFHGK